MALTPSQQITRWGIALLVFILIFWYMGSVFTPYIVGMVIAYFLDPVADRLEARGWSRMASVALISVIACVVVFGLFLAIVPTLFTQLSNLVNDIPNLFTAFQSFITERFPDLNISALFDRFEQALQRAGSMLGSMLLSSAQGAFSFISMLVIIPVVAFFMLLDWDKFVAAIDALLPRDHVQTIRQIMHDVDRAIAGFIRGQGTVCLVMAAYYGTALQLLGLNYGLVLGAIAGILTFIPYVGGFVGGGLVVGFALFQFWGDWTQLAIILVAYFGGQTFEGNVLTPNLVGNSVGLHPVMIMLSLSVFGSLMGLTGMLIAVPVTAAFAVVVRFLIGQYKKGKLYLGSEYGQTTIAEE